MEIVVVLLLAAPMLAATAYVHHRLPIHTRHHTGATWLLRLVLIGVGILAGYLGVASTPDASFAMRWASFLFGFGVAHVPAFVILYIKRQRGEYGA